jgi:hypothetical protein
MTKLVLAACVALVCAFALDGRRSVPDCYITPQSTIAAYWNRMIERRHAEALQCFVGPMPREAGGMMQLPNLVELRCSGFRLAWRGQGIVDVNYDVEYRITLRDSLARFPTGDRLNFTDGGWKIDRPLVLASRRP